MGIPDDVKEKSIKLNGYMAEKLYDYPYTDIYEKNLYVYEENGEYSKEILEIYNKKECDKK